MSRKTRRAPTLEEHYAMATAIRNAEEAISKVLEGCRYLYRDEVLRTTRALNSMGALKSRLDDTMFQDYPELPQEWVNFYYGEQEDADALIADEKV